MPFIYIDAVILDKVMTPINCFHKECAFILKSTLLYFRLYFNSGNFMNLCVSRCILQNSSLGLVTNNKKYNF